MRAPTLLLQVATILLAAYHLNSQQSPVQLHGSDLFEPWLKTYLESENISFKIDMHMTGSFSGLKAFEKGYADACLCISEQAETVVDPNSICVGYYVIHLFAAESFPSASIHKDQVFQIASITGRHTLNQWIDVFPEASDGWETKQMGIIIYDPSDQFLPSLFRSTFLNGEPFSNNVKIAKTRAELIAHTNTSDGFLLATTTTEPPIEKQKQIFLTDFKDTVPFSPAYENVAYGDYPATFPIVLRIRKDFEFHDELVDIFTSQPFRAKLKIENLVPSIGSN